MFRVKIYSREISLKLEQSKGREKGKQTNMYNFVISTRIEGQNVFFSDYEDKMKIDAIVWCTGYDKVMPYLSPECGLQVLHDGYVVDPLYLHLINIKYPSMAVLHLVTGNVPFPQIHQQVLIFYKIGIYLFNPYWSGTR